MFEISEMLTIRAVVARPHPQSFIQNFGILPTNSPTFSSPFIIIAFICLFKTGIIRRVFYFKKSKGKGNSGDLGLGRIMILKWSLQ